MTAKDKAQDLVNKFAKIQEKIDWTEDKQLMELCGERNEALGQQGEYYWNELAKQSALIAVDSILKECHNQIIVSHRTGGYKSFEDFNQNLIHIQNELDGYVLSSDAYWQEVKHEITKL
jgi:hypothetical protein